MALRGAEGRLEVLSCRNQCVLGLIGQRLAAGNLLKDLWGVGVEVLVYLVLEAADVFNGNDVEDASLGE